MLPSLLVLSRLLLQRGLDVDGRVECPPTCHCVSIRVALADNDTRREFFVDSFRNCDEFCLHADLPPVVGEVLLAVNFTCSDGSMEIATRDSAVVPRHFINSGRPFKRLFTARRPSIAQSPTESQVASSTRRPPSTSSPSKVNATTIESSSRNTTCCTTTQK